MQSSKLHELSRVSDMNQKVFRLADKRCGEPRALPSRIPTPFALQSVRCPIQVHPLLPLPDLGAKKGIASCNRSRKRTYSPPQRFCRQHGFGKQNFQTRPPCPILNGLGFGTCSQLVRGKAKSQISRTISEQTKSRSGAKAPCRESALGGPHALPAVVDPENF